MGGAHPPERPAAIIQPGSTGGTRHGRDLGDHYPRIWASVPTVRLKAQKRAEPRTDRDVPGRRWPARASPPARRASAAHTCRSRGRRDRSSARGTRPGGRSTAIRGAAAVWRLFCLAVRPSPRDTGAGDVAGERGAGAAGFRDGNRVGLEGIGSCASLMRDFRASGLGPPGSCVGRQIALCLGAPPSWGATGSAGSRSLPTTIEPSRP
jgi:hypothetical protein